MAKPNIPPNTLLLDWKKGRLVANGYLALCAVLMFQVLALLILTMGLGWW